MPSTDIALNWLELAKDGLSLVRNSHDISSGIKTQFSSESGYETYTNLLN